MPSRFKSGAVIILLLLLGLSIAGFVLVKNLAVRSFTDSQATVEAGIEKKFDPFSSKYSLSRHMGTLDTWQTYANENFNYQLKHPRVWSQVKTTLAAGIVDKYQVSLADDVTLTVIVQNTFVMPKDAKIIKQNGDKFHFWQDEPSTKAVVVNKNKLFYIIRLEQKNYFGSEQEFKGTFFLILKNFQFSD